MYENNQLQFILTSEGRIMMQNEDTYEYQYFLKDHLGNTRITLSQNGTILQENAYYPFGMNIAGLSSANSSPENKYKYNGKELEGEFGLDWYDYGARFYDVALARFHSVDPMADQRLWVSPYNFVQNNPINRIDPTGALDDWYQSEAGNIIWQDGDAQNITVNGEEFNNIGKTYTQDLGDGVSITYSQNEASSMTETVLTGDDWATQQNRDGVNCWDASSEMVENGGAEPLAGRANGIETGAESGTKDNYTVNATDNSTDGQNYLDGQINQGNPILVGVDYAYGKNRNGGTTDHFVAVSSRTTNLQTGGKSYNFYEPGTQWKAKGTHSSNVFNPNSKGLLQGTTNYSGKTYTVTHVRKNK